MICSFINNSNSNWFYFWNKKFDNGNFYFIWNTIFGILANLICDITDYPSILSVSITSNDRVFVNGNFWITNWIIYFWFGNNNECWVWYFYYSLRSSVFCCKLFTGFSLTFWSAVMKIFVTNLSFSDFMLGAERRHCHIETFYPETFKYWIGVQWGQSYLRGRTCLFSLGWQPF